MTKSDLKVESSDGQLLFDREAGAMIERSDKTRIKGDMTLNVNGNDIPITLDLTLEAKTETNAKPKS